MHVEVLLVTFNNDQGIVIISCRLCEVQVSIEMTVHAGANLLCGVKTACLIIMLTLKTFSVTLVVSNYSTRCRVTTFKSTGN